MSTIVKVTQDQLIRLAKQNKPGQIFRLDYYAKKYNKDISRLAMMGVKKGDKGDPDYTKPDSTFVYYDCEKRGKRGPLKKNLRGMKTMGITYKVR